MSALFMLPSSVSCRTPSLRLPTLFAGAASNVLLDDEGELNLPLGAARRPRRGRGSGRRAGSASARRPTSAVASGVQLEVVAAELAARARSPRRPRRSGRRCPSRSAPTISPSNGASQPSSNRRALEQPGEADLVGVVLDLGGLALAARDRLGQLGQVARDRVVAGADLAQQRAVARRGRGSGGSAR